MITDSFSKSLARCRVLYLGSAPVSESRIGVESLQRPFSHRYKDSSSVRGVDARLLVYSTGIQIQFVKNPENIVWFPISSLHVCAAVKFVTYVNGASGQTTSKFLPIDSITPELGGASPPMFGFISKAADKLLCHVFVCRTDQASLILVQCATNAYETRDTSRDEEPTQCVSLPEEGGFLAKSDSLVTTFNLSHPSGHQNTLTRSPLTGPVAATNWDTRSVATLPPGLRVVYAPESVVHGGSEAIRDFFATLGHTSRRPQVVTSTPSSPVNPPTKPEETPAEPKTVTEPEVSTPRRDYSPVPSDVPPAPAPPRPTTLDIPKPTHAHSHSSHYSTEQTRNVLSNDSRNLSTDFSSRQSLDLSRNSSSTALAVPPVHYTANSPSSHRKQSRRSVSPITFSTYGSRGNKSTGKQGKGKGKKKNESQSKSRQNHDVSHTRPQYEPAPRAQYQAQYEPAPRAQYEAQYDPRAQYEPRRRNSVENCPLCDPMVRVACEICNPPPPLMNDNPLFNGPNLKLNPMVTREDLNLPPADYEEETKTFPKLQDVVRQRADSVMDESIKDQVILRENRGRRHDPLGGRLAAANLSRNERAFSQSIGAENRARAMVVGHGPSNVYQLNGVVGDRLFDDLQDTLGYYP